jgi:hypothetical protein
MKNIFFLLLITNSLNCMAQLSPHPVGSYTTNGLLDKFVGTWMWTSGTDTMTVVLQKQKIHYPSPFDYDIDQIVGWHRYVKAGVLMESSLQYVGTPFSNGHSTLLGWTENKSRLRLTFDDLSKQKHSNELYFTMLNGSTTQANWSIRNSEGLKNGGYDHSFTVPTTMAFTKL